MADLLPVPKAEARLTLTDGALDSIPHGHALSRSEGRATAAIGRSPGGAITVTATCDSLERQLLLYEQGYSRLMEEYEALSDSLRTMYEARTQEERKRTKPPEWAWAVAGLAVGAALVKLKTKR